MGDGAPAALEAGERAESGAAAERESTASSSPAVSTPASVLGVLSKLSPTLDTKIQDMRAAQNK